MYGELNQIKDRKESIELTKKIFSQIKKETEIVGWKNKTSTEKNIKIVIYDVFSKAGFTDEQLSELSDKLITLAKNRL